MAEDDDPYDDLMLSKKADDFLKDVDQSAVSKKIYDMKITPWPGTTLDIRARVPDQRARTPSFFTTFTNDIS